jgi:hypothetical protein
MLNKTASDKKVLHAWLYKFLVSVFLFIPFFAGTGFLICQIPDAIQIFEHKNLYKPYSVTVIESRILQLDAKNRSKFFDFKIEHDTVSINTKELKKFSQLKEIKIGDTLHVWYYADCKPLPRLAQESSFNYKKYIYSKYLWIILAGISPFLIWNLILFILKKKKKQSI